MLPEAVLKRAAEELCEYGTTGQSVMEMSHRSPEYQRIIDEAEADLREIMSIPDNYKVLFLQGGASTQFAMVPLNLLYGSGKADFVLTGQWAKKAYKEAAKYGSARAIASSEDRTFAYIPTVTPDMIDPEADFVHICMNNTIYGTLFHTLPDTGKVPLVADISSCILSEPIDVSRFGILYAGAQKNVGPAGLTIVIIREDLIGHAMDITPTMLDYKTHADAGSMFNTPPCYSIYVAGLVFKWIKELGGLSEMKKLNEQKAKILYDFLDTSKLFRGTVDKDSRSLMNVPFVTGDEALDKKFVTEAKERGLYNLKGHRSVGGMRASIYNAMPKEGVLALVEFMKEFEEKNNVQN